MKQFISYELRRLKIYNIQYANSKNLKMSTVEYN